MRARVRDVAYALTGISILTIHYFIPYTILKNAEGFSLYAFWGLLATVWLLITIAYLKGHVDE
jgi:hypothetical protein